MNYNDYPLPKSMKSAKDRRPSIWRQGVLQIWVTRACDKSCFGCTQGSNLGGKPGMITPEQFGIACDSLKDYFGVVGMFGGNPTMHPEFDELCRIMRAKIPFEQRGLWSNNLRGKGSTCRITFNPRVSNLNVHLDQAAYDEMNRSWPEAASTRTPKGQDSDSRHSPVYVAMQDTKIEPDARVVFNNKTFVYEIVPGQIKDKDQQRNLTPEELWNLVSTCDINQYWSAMICVVRGELRGYFCEIAGAQAMLHQNDPNWPITGVEIKPGWWNVPMSDFESQARLHCTACGFPLRGYGELAIGGKVEQVSVTHADIYKPKVKGREVQLVELQSQLGETHLVRGTDYIENGSLK